MEPDFRFVGWSELATKLSNTAIVCNDNVDVGVNLSAFAAASPVVRSALDDLPGLMASDISIVMPDFSSVVVKKAVAYFLGEDVVVAEVEDGDVDGRRRVVADADAVGRGF